MLDTKLILFFRPTKQRFQDYKVDDFSVNKINDFEALDQVKLNETEVNIRTQVDANSEDADDVFNPDSDYSNLYIPW